MKPAPGRFIFVWEGVAALIHLERARGGELGNLLLGRGAFMQDPELQAVAVDRADAGGVDLPFADIPPDLVEMIPAGDGVDADRVMPYPRANGRVEGATANDVGNSTTTLFSVLLMIFVVVVTVLSSFCCCI